MRTAAALLALALGLLVSAQPRDCRAQGVCAGSTCITDAECGYSCRCGRPGPGPEGFCYLK